MILYIDCGNTFIKLYLKNESMINKVYEIDTKKLKYSNIKKILKSFNYKFSNVVLSSVISENKNNLILKSVKKILKIDALIFIKEQVKNIDFSKINIKTIGQDICLATLGATKYSNTNIVCDFGTATTIAFLNNNIFEFYYIIPGVNTSFNALVNNAEKLKNYKYDLKYLKEEPRNSIEAISSGLIYSHYYAILGIINNIISKYNLVNYKIIFTGQLSKLFLSFNDHNYIYDENLVINGLDLYLNNNI